MIETFETVTGVRKKKTIDQHGESRIGKWTPEYRAWASMIQRCENTKCKNYQNYGGRGISVCDIWRESYSEFLISLGRKPTPKHSLDRIDVNGNYEPGNCRWATTMEQRLNRRDTKLITIGDRSMTFSDWAREGGIAPHVALQRICYGWTVLESVTTPVRVKRKSHALIGST